MLVSLYISYRALAVLVGAHEPTVDPVWYAFVVVAIVIAIDLSRTTVSLRAARQFGSPALAANALHFGSDLAGSTAVLGGPAPRARGLEGGRRARGALRRDPRPRGRGAADAAERRRPHGPRPGRRGASGARRDRPGGAVRPAPPAAHAPGGRQPLRGRRDRRLAGRGGGAGARGRRRRRGGRPARPARQRRRRPRRAHGGRGRAS